MSDDFTQLNQARTAGDIMDESGVAFGTTPLVRKRPRVVVGGENAGEIAKVLNAQPTGSEYALVVRQNVPTYPGTQIAQEGEVTLVSTSIETTVASYTVPASTTFNFIGLVASGNMDAVFRLYVNSNKILTLRNSVAMLTASLSFTSSPFNAPAGSIVSIKVLQTNSVSGNFEGTLFGYIQ